MSSPHFHNVDTNPTTPSADRSNEFQHDSEIYHQQNFGLKLSIRTFNDRLSRITFDDRKRQYRQSPCINHVSIGPFSVKHRNKNYGQVSCYYLLQAII